MTSLEFVLEIPSEKFDRFEDSLSIFRDRENPYEREREWEHSIFGNLDFNTRTTDDWGIPTSYHSQTSHFDPPLVVLVLNGLPIILYLLYIF